MNVGTLFKEEPRPKDIFTKSGHCWTGIYNAALLKEALDIGIRIRKYKPMGQIAGGYVPRSAKSIAKPFLAKLTDYIKGRVDQAPADWSCKGLYLITAPTDTGPQFLHKDRPTEDKGGWIVIIHLDSTKSTHVSKVDYTLLTKSEHWRTSETISYDATPGSMMMLYDDVIHGGPDNHGDPERNILFTMFGPPTYSYIPDLQQPEWRWAEMAYGFCSKEHLEAIVRNLSHDPVSRYSTASARKAIRAALERRGGWN